MTEACRSCLPGHYYLKKATSGQGKSAVGLVLIVFFFSSHDIPIEIEGPTYEHDSWSYIVVGGIGGQLVATCKRGVNAVLSLNYSHICLQQVGPFMVDRFSSGLLKGHFS